MQIRIFNEKDLEEMNSWYFERGMLGISLESLPQVGFVIEGVAALFVYLTDSNIALIEGLVTNPKKSLMKRERAVRLLVSQCESYAKQIRQKVVVLIEKKSVRGLAKNLNYKSVGFFEMLVKEV